MCIIYTYLYYHIFLFTNLFLIIQNKIKPSILAVIDQPRAAADRFLDNAV